MMSYLSKLPAPEWLGLQPTGTMEDVILGGYAPVTIGIVAACLALKLGAENRNNPQTTQE
jgi:hypothetical protein